MEALFPYAFLAVGFGMIGWGALRAWYSWTRVSVAAIFGGGVIVGLVLAQAAAR